MGKKIWVIARHDLIQTYTDANLLLIMFATPLVLATIIGLALGGTGGDSSPITDIPLAIVNLDDGDQGVLLADILAPSAVEAEGPANAGGGGCAALADETGSGQPMTLETLLAPVVLDDPDAARRGVHEGRYAAAVIIPPDFSEKIGYSQQDPTLDSVQVDIIADGGQSVSATIVRSVVESVVGQLKRGNITVAATLETLAARAQARPASFGLDFLILTQSDTFQPNFACAFDPAFNVIRLEEETLRGESSTFSPLVYFGSAQAMFFLLFTAQGGANSILEDRRQGVLQRLLVSPTPQVAILLGKLMGAFAAALTQLLLLFFGFTLVGSVMNGEFTFIWGNNLPLILVLAVVAALSVSGLGTLIAAVATSPDQANIVGTTINIAMGALGGAFFVATDLPFLQPVQWLSLVYWGQDAFMTLANGGTNIWLNVAVLLVQGALMFLLGLWLFDRRLDE